MPYADPVIRREYHRKRKAARRAAYMAGKVCVLCGSNEILEIDHTNPLTKVHIVASSQMWAWSDRRLEEELKKCRVLCQKCHRSKFKSDMLLRRPLIHGTVRAYKSRGCRCNPCKESYSVYQKAYYNTHYKHQESN